MRCFLAIELPKQIRSRLATLQDRLRLQTRGVRWTPTEQIHLTLKFLGEVPDGEVAAVCQRAAAVAARFQPLDLEVRGAGCFPPGGAVRIVWAGLADPSKALPDCQQACEDACAELGFKPENRAFQPHLTIGRVRNATDSRRIREVVAGEASFAAGRFTAAELVCFQSVLRPTGPTYTILSQAPFGGKG